MSNNKKKWLFWLAGIVVIILLFVIFFIQAITIPTTQKIGLSYKTTPSVSASEYDNWNTVGFAKELINQLESIAVISGGDNPISNADWDTFKPRFPWTKNIDRHLLFQNSYFIRSPYAEENCVGNNCLTTRAYKGYTWIELAQPVAVDYTPDKTNFLKPEPGHLVTKVIVKCQLIRFEDSIYQMTDGKGNYYVMHATETGTPTESVILPDGWSIKQAPLEEPLVISPFGSSGECYYNIVGDHLGQGYHQYIYANETYP